MKELNFEQMEIISAGLTQNQTCLILGGITGISLFTMNWNFGAGAFVAGLVYGCF